MDRRRALQLLAGAGAASLVGCTSNGDEEAASTTTTAGTSALPVDGAPCSTIPEETAGPFPGNGSNGPDVLAEPGVVRRDITTSIGATTGTAAGVPLTMTLLVQDRSGCGPMPGAAVHVWQCDREGRYSMYSPGAEGENYLRGVQEADADGLVTFTSIFPGAYAGRWPHVHFEVYGSVEDATNGGAVLVTSQLAFPQDVCDAAYATEGYEDSVRNMTELSLATDGVFADGVDEQLARMTGDATGFTAELDITV